MLDLIFTHSFGIAQSVLVMGILIKMTKTDFKLKTLLLTVFIIYIPYAILVLQFDISIWTIYTWTFLSIFAYHIGFKQSWLMSMLLAVVANFIILTGEYIFFLLYLILPSSMVEFFLMNHFAPRVIPTICFVLIYILTHKSNTRNDNFIAIEYFAKWYWILYFLIFGIMADLSFVFLLNAPQIGDGVPSVLIMILFLAFFLHIIWHLNSFSRSIAFKERFETEQIYSKSLEDAMDEISGFRHDFANMVHTINGLLRQENIAKLGIYMETLSSKTIASMMVEEIEELKKVPILYGIMVSKISFAKENGITFDLSINCDDIDLQFLSTVDYSRMMGIFLDNAFDHAIKTNKRSVYFDIRTKQGQLITSVMNLCDCDIDLDQIFTHGYSTKETPSGKGLYQVLQMLTRYKQYGDTLQLNTTLKHGMFRQELIVG